MDPNIPTPMTVPPSQRPREAGAPAPEVPTTPAPVVPLANTIRTMKSDSAKAIKEQGGTLVSLALAEEKKKSTLEAQKKVVQAAPAAPTLPKTPTKEVPPKASPEILHEAPAPRPIGRIFVMLGIIVLFTAIGLGVWFALPYVRTINLSRPTAPTTPTFGTTPIPSIPIVAPRSVPLVPSLIPATSQKELTVDAETPEHLFALIAVERTSGSTPGAVKDLYFSETTTAADGSTKTSAISANHLFLLAQTPAPAILTRSLETPFMAGLIGEEGNIATPFLVFNVSGYDTGLAGMLAWERDLPHFIDEMFGTKITGGIFAPVRFRDTTIAKRDARTLGGTTTSSITYAFATPTTIVIAGTPTALAKLLPMLTAR